MNEAQAVWEVGKALNLRFDGEEGEIIRQIMELEENDNDLKAGTSSLEIYGDRCLEGDILILNDTIIMECRCLGQREKRSTLKLLLREKQN